MNKTETVLLCRYVKAMCPAQAIDEYTPDAWFDILDDIELDEAKAAIREGVRDRGWRFIDVTDVVDVVRRTRSARLEAWVRKFGPLIPPYEVCGDVAVEREWRMMARRQILDGEVSHPSELGTDTITESTQSLPRGKSRNPTGLSRDELRKALLTHPTPAEVVAEVQASPLVESGEVR